MKQTINLNRLAYFATVVDAGSFTRAADRLGITKAVVSQQVARLERELGVTLLLRTTRSLVPTDAGRALHARCRVMLQESAAAFEELGQAASEPRGTLKVAAPFDYGSSVVVPVVARFTRQYPGCQVALSLSDRLVDVQAVDVAVRVGWPKDSSHAMRRIGAMEELLVCSRALVKQLERPRDPEDLAQLPFVANASLAEPSTWRFSHPQRGRRTVRFRATCTIDATPAILEAVLAGAGAAVLPDYLVNAELRAGRIVRLLPEWKLRTGSILVLLPSARFRPAKVTKFVEMLAQ